MAVSLHRKRAGRSCSGAGWRRHPAWRKRLDDADFSGKSRRGTSTPPRSLHFAGGVRIRPERTQEQTLELVQALLDLVLGALHAQPFRATPHECLADLVGSGVADA